MRHDAGRKKKFTLSEKNCIDKVESGVMETDFILKHGTKGLGNLNPEKL